MKEYFVVYYYKHNDSGIRDFMFSWGENPREASERAYQKNPRAFETFVYESADSYHRHGLPLYSNQNFERMR